MRNPHQPRDHEYGPNTGQASAHQATEEMQRQEALRDLAAGFGEGMPNNRLKVYLQALDGIELPILQKACTIIRDSDHYDRLLPPGKVRALALHAQAGLSSSQPSPEELEARRATLMEIDEVFATLKSIHPESPFIRAVYAEHERQKLRLEEGSGQRWA
jgi:hypothetical protein